MFDRLIQLGFLLGFCIISSSEWDILFNLNEDDKLLCYSCKGNECGEIINNDENKILCNKNTQLCWAGFVDQQPYRTCASRFCTPSDISLDSNIQIETCCRSNLCNSISLIGKSYKKNLSSYRRPTTDSGTTRMKNATTRIIGEIIDEKSAVSIDEVEDTTATSELQLNESNLDTMGIDWDRLSYDKDFSNRVASISSVLLFLMPLLLVLLF